LIVQIHPELVDVEQWISRGEQLIVDNLPIQTDAQRVDETLNNLEQIIHKFEVNFIHKQHTPS
jgi:SepF-like predicted cell division protein (DUF552 family)